MQMTLGDRTNDGFINRFVGFFKNQKKILVIAHYCNHADFGYAAYIGSKCGCGAFYLYAVLMDL